MYKKSLILTVQKFALGANFYRSNEFFFFIVLRLAFAGYLRAHVFPPDPAEDPSQPPAGLEYLQGQQDGYQYHHGHGQGGNFLHQGNHLLLDFGNHSLDQEKGGFLKKKDLLLYHSTVVVRVGIRASTRQIWSAGGAVHRGSPCWPSPCRRSHLPPSCPG